MGRLSLLPKEKEPKEEKENSIVPCPIHGFPIIKPCDLKKCQNYVQSSASKNCLTYSIEKIKNNRLPSSAVAILMKTSISEVNQATANAINKIKHAIIREKIESVTPYKFKYIVGHCINCGMALHDNLAFDHPANLVIEENKFAWCEDACKRAKPKWQFLLEREFGVTFELILAVSVSIYKQPQLVDQLFGLPNNTTKVYMSQIRNLIENF